MKFLKGFALRGKIAVAAFALAMGAGVLGALLPQTHAAFAESETQATVPASTEEQLEQTPRAEGDVEIEAPKLVSEASVSYDGKPHRFVITGYNNIPGVMMSIDAGGINEDTDTMEGVVICELTEASYYTVQFSIDSDGYVFPSGDNVSSDGKSVTIAFSITKATDQAVTLDEDYCFVYGEEIKIVPTVKYTEGNEITTTYYEYDSANGGPKGSPLGVVPKNAGVYYVEVSVSGTSNYEQPTDAHAVVVIEKKELKVSATVHASYGQQTPSTDEIRYKIAGFAYDETADNCVNVNLVQVAQGMKYGDGTGLASVGAHTPQFAMTDVTVNAYKGKTVKSIYGFSKKGNADNYYFTAADNCLVDVRPLSVSVVIGNASGSFSATPQYNSGITLRWADSAANRKIPEVDRNKQDDELKKLLNVSANSFHCTVSATSDVGKYPIQIVNAKNDNYAVTFVDGVYEVLPASLVVRWSEGGGSYGSVIAPEISSVSALIDNKLQPITGEFGQAVHDGLSFRFTDLTGNQTFEKGEVPQKAGNYSVALTFTTEGRIGKNYVLNTDSAASRRFSVSKLMLDVEKLRVDDSDGKLAYNNGNVIEPTLLESGLEDYYDVVIDEAKVVGTYYVTFTLKDFDNMQWSFGKTADYKVPFVVTKAKNKIIGSIVIEGWTYGDAEKTPSVTLSSTKDISDDVDIVPIFEYSSDNGTNWTNVVPTAAGNYLVRATTKATTNVDAFASMSATPFAIARKAIAKPRLDVTTANNVYTGEDLHASVTGFDQTLMTFTYKGNFTAEGNDIALTVRNAGTYTIVVELVNSNYVWADGDKKSAFEQAWTVAPKPIEKPTAGENSFPTIDKVITYLPDGFDENTMTITGNEAGYNGSFKAEISLKDSANYVWDDGTVDSIQFDWEIGGVNTAFVALVSVLAVLAAVGVGAGIAQYLLFKRKQKREAEASDEEDTTVETKESEGGEQA